LTEYLDTRYMCSQLPSAAYVQMWLVLLHKWDCKMAQESVPRPEILFGGVQQIQLKTVGRENGDLGATAP
jgi:hypothetical protein